MNNLLDNKDEHTKWNLENNNFEADNFEDFEKVVIDHKGAISHTTVRGLTKCDNGRL